MFTFETRYAGSDWLRSGKRLDTEEGAIKAAIEWAEVLLLNGEAVCIRVIKL